MPQMVVAFREGEPDRGCVLEQGIPCIVGRSPDAHLVLPDSTISRHHATLQVEGEEVFIEDNGSTNGEFVNRHQVQRTVVKEGDFLTLGAYTLVLRQLGGPVDPSSLRGKTHCIGIDSARKLHEEALNNQVPRYFQVLYQTALLLGKRTSLETLAPRVISWTVQVLRARFGSIAISTDEFQKPHKYADYSRDNAVYAPRLSENLASFVMNNKTAILSNDPLHDPRFYTSKSLISQDIQSVMCTPLCGDERVVGILYVDNDKRDSQFNNHDLEFLTAIGHLLGLAIENKMMEERMVKQERLASLGEAIAGIGHDMSNVLTGILGGVEMLKMSLEEGNIEEARKTLDFIRTTSSRVESYFEELVAFSKDSDLHFIEANITNVIAEAVDALQQSALKVGVSLRFEGNEDHTEFIDATKFYRVLANLIKNGVEACKAGGEVVVETQRLDSELLIHVSDTGSGIEPDDIPRLSEPFFTRKGSKGTGLGLAISYRITEQHGGSIQVESQVGEGTCFTLSLPTEDLGAINTLHHKDVPSNDGSFTECNTCNSSWGEYMTFLADPAVSVMGYKARTEKPDAGVFQFRHNCGAGVTVPAEFFWKLYNGVNSEAAKAPESSVDATINRKPREHQHSLLHGCAIARSILMTLNKWPKDMQ